MKSVFDESSEIVFQCVGSKESDWWSEMRCCHVNFKACHVKSAARAIYGIYGHFALTLNLYLFLNSKPSAISRAPFLVKKISQIGEEIR